jgi:hypothetical protein
MDKNLFTITVHDGVQWLLTSILGICPVQDLEAQWLLAPSLNDFPAGGPHESSI